MRTVVRLGALLVLAEVGIRLWPLSRISTYLERRRLRRAAPADHRLDVAELAEWIERIDHHGPWRPSCLREAVVLAWILSERGWPAAIRIGVKHDGRLRAHAWVELEGQHPVQIFGDATYAELQPGRGPAVRIGREPVPAVHVMEDNDEAYEVWRRAGVRGRTILHIDAHPDFDGGRDDAFVNIANFLRPAIRDGTVKTVYWIVPDPSWDDPRQRQALLAELHALHARSAEIPGNVHVGDHELSCTILGAQVHVRSFHHLPALEEPILLDLDTDVLMIADIPDADDIPPRPAPWCWPEQLIRRLGEAGLRTDFATVAYSVRGGYTPLRWKFLGDELADRLRHPRHADERRWALQRRAVLAMVEGRIDEAARAFETALADHPQDASLWFGLAETRAEQGHAESARACYRLAVNADASYQTGHNGLALRYVLCGDLVQAERESRRMLLLNLDDVPARYALASTAARQERWLDALAMAQDLVAREPAFIDGHELLADALEHLGRLDEAIAAYEHALKLSLGEAMTLDERFIATRLPITHRIGGHHFAVHERLARLYGQAGREAEAMTSHRMWLAACQVRGR